MSQWGSAVAYYSCTPLYKVHRPSCKYNTSVDGCTVCSQCLYTIVRSYSVCIFGKTKGLRPIYWSMYIYLYYYKTIEYNIIMQKNLHANPIFKIILFGGPGHLSIWWVWLFWKLVKLFESSWIYYPEASVLLLM